MKIQFWYDFRCTGSITIIHYDRLGSQPLHDMKALKLKGKKYRNIRKLSSNREIIRVRSEGNCCWRVFNRIKHTGQMQQISPGFDAKPNIKIKSVTRTSCWKNCTWFRKIRICNQLLMSKFVSNILLVDPFCCSN